MGDVKNWYSFTRTFYNGRPEYRGEEFIFLYAVHTSDKCILNYFTIKAFSGAEVKVIKIMEECGLVRNYSPSWEGSIISGYESYRKKKDVDKRASLTIKSLEKKLKNISPRIQRTTKRKGGV